MVNLLCRINKELFELQKYRDDCAKYHGRSPNRIKYEQDKQRTVIEYVCRQEPRPPKPALAASAPSPASAPDSALQHHINGFSNAGVVSEKASSSALANGESSAASSLSSSGGEGRGEEAQDHNHTTQTCIPAPAASSPAATPPDSGHAAQPTLSPLIGAVLEAGEKPGPTSTPAPVAAAAAEPLPAPAVGRLPSAGADPGTPEKCPAHGESSAVFSLSSSEGEQAQDHELNTMNHARKAQAELEILPFSETFGNLR